MVYSINGVALDNAARSWNLLNGSKLRTEIARSLASVPIQGRDGVVAGLPGDAGPAVHTLIIDTPVSEYGSLHALISKGGTLTNSEWPARSALFEYVSHTVAEDEDNLWLQATYVIRIPGTYWRDTALISSGPTSLSGASITHDLLLPGISAPVPDAMIRVRGAATGLLVTDTAGSWFTYTGAILNTEWLRFEAETGRAYVTTSDVWTGGTEVSGLIDYGGPRGVFEITPYWAGVDPTTRTGRVTVATATRTGATAEARARAAYVG